MCNAAERAQVAMVRAMPEMTRHVCGASLRSRSSRAGQGGGGLVQVELSPPAVRTSHAERMAWFPNDAPLGFAVCLALRFGVIGVGSC
jgi:hypothetical protein